MRFHVTCTRLCRLISRKKILAALSVGDISKVLKGFASAITMSQSNSKDDRRSSLRRIASTVIQNNKETGSDEQKTKDSILLFSQWKAIMGGVKGVNSNTNIQLKPPIKEMFNKISKMQNGSKTAASGLAMNVLVSAVSGKRKKSFRKHKDLRLLPISDRAKGKIIPDSLQSGLFRFATECKIRRFKRNNELLSNGEKKKEQRGDAVGIVLSVKPIVFNSASPLQALELNSGKVVIVGIKNEYQDWKPGDKIKTYTELTFRLYEGVYWCLGWREE